MPLPLPSRPAPQPHTHPELGLAHRLSQLPHPARPTWYFGVTLPHSWRCELRAIALQALDDVAEHVKAAFPLPAVLVDPGRPVLERGQLQPTGPPLGIPAPGDEPRPL